MLTGAQTCNCSRVIRVAGKVKSAQSFDCKYLSGMQPGCSLCNWRAGRLDTLHLEPKPWPAGGAGNGLGVKPTVGGVCVFRRTVRAHRKGGHRGLRPVIGQTTQDRKPGAAPRAIGEGIAKAALGRIKDLGQTLGAGRRIWHDPCLRAPAPARGDDEPLRRSCKAVWHGFHRVDPRQRRGLGAQRRFKTVQICARNPDQHALTVIQHIARQSHPDGQLPDERAETHPLHLTTHPDATPFGHSTR